MAAASLSGMKLRVLALALVMTGIWVTADLLVRSPVEQLEQLEDVWAEADNLTAAIAERIDPARVPVEVVRDGRRITVDRESNIDVFELLEDVDLEGRNIVQRTLDRSKDEAKVVLRIQQDAAEWSIFTDLTHRPDGWLVRKIRIHQS